MADESRVAAMLGRHPQLTTVVDGRGDQPIHHVARNGDTEIVRLLIAHGACVNTASQQRHTVLYCAAGHGDLDTVKLLLEHKVDVDAKFSGDGKDIRQ